MRGKTLPSTVDFDRLSFPFIGATAATLYAIALRYCSKNSSTYRQRRCDSDGKGLQLFRNNNKLRAPLAAAATLRRTAEKTSGATRILGH